MLPIVDGPLPDWGLKCPACQAPLAGATEEACPACGRAFDLVQLVARHRPVPEIGLECPNCGYSLTGLPGSTCPECGVGFDAGELLEQLPRAHAPGSVPWMDPPDHHLPKRAPEFTGGERPLPDFGLFCSACGASLSGASENQCPQCGQPFELPAIPRGDWVPIATYVPARVRPITRTILYNAQIPYIVDNTQLSEVFGGISQFYSRVTRPTRRLRVRIPREFFFDALLALAEAAKPPPECVRNPWTCESCGSQIPAGFEVCWNCGEPHPGLAES